MPKGEAIFYVGRLVKIGFAIDNFIDALLDSLPYSEEDEIWSIVKVEKNYREGIDYYSGKLNKAKPDTKYTVLSNDLKSEEDRIEQNMVVASSSFIYIPEFSGIVFHSIANQIEPKKFIKKFSRIIESTLGNVLAACEINLIDDLTEFYKRINEFSFISIIKTTVQPPNPLFGRFWEPLKNYLSERQVEEYQQKEISKKKGLKCDIAFLLKLLIEGNEDKINDYLKTHTPTLSDLAILMSLDGYGDGRIDGMVNGRHVFIKTHERALHFSLPSTFTNDLVFDDSYKIYKEINNERYMEH